MPLCPRVAARPTTVATLPSTAVALPGALVVSGCVRPVDILTLYFGGAGAGLVARIAAGRAASSGAAERVAYHGALHTPPTVSWRDPAPRDAPRPPG